MGTVRRSGDWRLEKRGDGIYEITFRREPQERIITDDAAPGAASPSLLDPIPVNEVASYQEAEGLFEERAHGPPPLGESYTEDGSSSSGDPTSGGLLDEDIDLSDLSNGGIAVVLVIAGGFSLYLYSSSTNAYLLLFGLVLTAGGLALVGYAGYLYRNEDWQTAWAFLTETHEDEPGAGESTDQVETTPPTGENLRNDLYFDRAEQHCEWCGDWLDFPEVHHITPRSEGGPNDPSNLLVLCPNCHKQMEAIGRNRQRRKAKEQTEAWDREIES